MASRKSSTSRNLHFKENYTWWSLKFLHLHCTVTYT